MPTLEQLQNQAIDGFWETIPPLWSTIRSHIRAAALGKFDVTVEQFHVLRHVQRGIGSVSELAAVKNISRPAISQAVELLVNKGLLTRIQNTRDRRYVELTLTENGESMLDAIFDETSSWMKERMHALTSNELLTISKAMESLKTMLVEKQPA
jgi:MarR family transcriptional regulator, organic hydroperoxide resistance regulator